MSGPSVPQYGNFGGNGDNDAWEQADRYATFAANGYNPTAMAGGPPGSGNLPDPRDYPGSMSVHIARTPGNVAFVKTVLADIDRQPKNDVDTAYLNHDLGYVQGEVITNVINNVQMGASVWAALLYNGYTIDPYGRLYGQSSIPFIVGVGSAFNVLTETKNQTPGSDSWEVEAVVVTAAMQRSNHLIELAVRLTKAAGGFVDSIVTVADDSWNGLTSALGSAASSISSALGNAWSWFKNIFSLSVGPNNLSVVDAAHHDVSHTDALDAGHDSQHSLWGDTSGVKMEYVKVSAGDRIDILHLSNYDDNGDGLLTLDDNIVASLGIAATPNGSLRAFAAGDAINVATGKDASGQAVEVGALKAFYNAFNIGSSAELYAAEATHLGSADHAVQLVAPISRAPTELMAT
jgi:hypothetical protein